MSALPTMRKVATSIPGFDIISEGGVPEGRATLVAGTPGAGKTIFAGQFLAEGVREGGSVVFVTCEIPAADVARDLAGVGIDVAPWERDGRWVFVDASEGTRTETFVIGRFDLGALLARIREAVEKTGAKRVALDALDALSVRLHDPGLVRSEVIRIADALAELGVTCVMTAERLDEDGPLTRYGVEGFEVANVILMRNRLAAGRRRRTIEVLKMRGVSHQRGEFFFTIAPGKGIVVMPRTRDPQAPELQASSQRVTIGTPELDELLGGGPFRDNVILAAGGPGTGKTTLAVEFTAGGVKAGERALFVNFESPRSVLLRNARSIGHDLEALEREGRLRIFAASPESHSIDEHLVQIKHEIDDFLPDRVVVDSLQAMERIADVEAYRSFVIDLTSYLRLAGRTTFLTSMSAIPSQQRAPHVATFSDIIILMAYAERPGAIDHAMTILKARGSYHDPSVRKFWVDEHGLHLGDPLSRLTGILGAGLTPVAPEPVAGHSTT